MTWSNGGDIIDADGNVDFDTPEFNEAVDLYTGLYADGSVPTNGDFDQTQGFISGVAPMLISGPYLAKSIADSAPELDGKWQRDDGARGLGVGDVALRRVEPRRVAQLDPGRRVARPASSTSPSPRRSSSGTRSTASCRPRRGARERRVPAATRSWQVYAEQLADAKLLPLVPNWDGGVGSRPADRAQLDRAQRRGPRRGTRRPSTPRPRASRSTDRSGRRHLDAAAPAPAGRSDHHRTDPTREEAHAHR